MGVVGRRSVKSDRVVFRRPGEGPRRRGGLQEQVAQRMRAAKARLGLAQC